MCTTSFALISVQQFPKTTIEDLTFESNFVQKVFDMMRQRDTRWKLIFGQDKIKKSLKKKKKYNSIKKSYIFWNEDFFSSILTHFLQNSTDLISYPYDDEIQQSVYSRTFEFRLSRILHQLCILTCENYYSVTPLRIFYHTSPQYDFIII